MSARSVESSFRYWKTLEPSSDGGATVTLKEAKHVVSPMTKNGAKLRFDELTQMDYLMTNIHADHSGAPGVEQFLKAFNDANNGMTRVTNGQSDWERAHALANALDNDVGVKTISLSSGQWPSKLRTALLKAKKELEKAPSEPDASTWFDRFCEVTAGGKIIGYAAIGGRGVEDGAILELTKAFAPDGKKLFNTVF